MCQNRTLDTISQSPAWRRASWALPPLFCVLFYWYGLKCWFRQDDFAWLQLTGQVHGWGDLWRMLFTPLAQGTIRPLSERSFFMGLYSLFGLDALPFRLVVFATQIANLTLIRAVGERLTGSAAAGFWAALLWTANTALIPVMTWSSVYNQALCGFFLLLAFYFLLRYIETGHPRYGCAQWIAFLVGFGALEVNVVYPALAAVYTLLCARKFFRRTLWLFIPSAVYTVVHRAVAPAVDAPSYVMRFDWSMLATFWQYLIWAPGADHLPTGHPLWLFPVGAGIILLFLAGFAAKKALTGAKSALFLVAWFVIILIPVLPLAYHLTEYYVMLPDIGLAILGGWALVSAWQSRWRYAALPLLALYLAPLPVIHAEVRDRYLFSRQIRSMVLGVQEARRLHPGKVILLRDVSDQLFWNGILDNPFAVIGVTNVYLAPETESAMISHPELGDFRQYILPAAATLEGLKAGKLVVYSAAGERLKNVTAIYAALAPLHLRAETPRTVDVANELLGYMLGKSWLPIEEGHRWMPKQATVRLGGPKGAGERLYISGYSPAVLLEKGPLPVTVSVDGQRVGEASIAKGVDQFHFDFRLPKELAGKESVEVTVEVGRTYGELGLVFGVFEIH